VSRTLTLERAVPDALRRDVLEKLPYASEHLRGFTLAPDGKSVTLEVDEAHAEVTLDKVRRLIDGTTRGYREVETEVIWRVEAAPSFRGDAWQELVARGLVSEESPGQIALVGEAALLAEALDRRFDRLARESFSATLEQYPTMLSMAAIDRAHYFDSFPQHVTFAPHLREDVDELSRISATPKHEGDFPFLQYLAPPRHVLSPAVCFHAYQRLADKPLAGDTCITARGRCFRYESKNFRGLERVWDFTLREIIFIGGKDWVDQQRERGAVETRRLVEKLGLTASLETANDPFFINNFVARKFFQRMTRTKYELQMALPHEGRSIAAASFNLHNDFLGQSFAIGLDGGSAFTSCIGYGIERWVYVMYAQLGPQLARWPAATRAELEL
jgi:hypothetical protein